MDPPDQIDSITGSATNEVAGDDSSLKQQDLVLSEVVKARERQIRERIGDFSSKIDSKLTDTNGLRVGVLQFGDDRNKLGKFGEYLHALSLSLSLYMCVCEVCVGCCFLK